MDSQSGAQRIQPMPAGAQPPSPMQPNVFQQSANNLTNASAAATNAAFFQPQQVSFGYQPQQIGTSFQPQQASAQSVSHTFQPQNVNTNFQAQNVGPNASMTQGYFNPFQQDVVNRSLSDIERSRQMAVNDTGASATAAGAFGGSRHGVAEGMTNEAFARTAADTAAGLNMQGFNTAQQMAQQAALANQGAGLQAQGMGLQAQGMNQQAGLANAGMGLQAQGMNQNAALQASLANQQAGLSAQGLNQNAALANQQAGLTSAQLGMQADLANQQAGLQAANLGLSGANTLGGLSGQGFNQGMAITNQQAAMGAQQQALNQAIMDAAAQQFQGFTGNPQQSLAMLLGGAQVPTGQTATQTMQPGLFDWLTLGAMV